jgi:arginine decarboxylase
MSTPVSSHPRKNYWSILHSRKFYGIRNWSNQYFDVNKKGNLSVHPRQSTKKSIDLNAIIQAVTKKGLKTPILVRFQDIIRHRVDTINEAFRAAIKEHNYEGKYRGVYPLKTNQMREVLDEILDAGSKYEFGLEAGSKAELLIVLAQRLSPKALVICNGYKDKDFLKAALSGNRIHKTVFIVIEKITELYDVLSVSADLGIVPLLGVRAKLSAKGTGRWESSSGEAAKFGLTVSEILQMVAVLKTKHLTKSLKLLHFHIGSQVTSIAAIKDAVKEAARIYAKLHQLGMNLEYLDVGGGLGIDYDGSQSDFESSMNYTLAQYCNDIVYSIQEVCKAEQVKEPHIVSESGRALVAHHSVLVVNVFGKIDPQDRQKDMEKKAETEEEADTVVQELQYLYDHLETRDHGNIFEAYQDALSRKEEALSKFKLGYLSLLNRARAENLFWKITHEVYQKALVVTPDNPELENLRNQLAPQYLCNFSIFQSMPDHWAISHLFPIMPIHRLKERPSEQVTLVDITCDSDGKICKFIDFKDVATTLHLHPLKPGKDYYLGIFLMGAYQDIMGDLHNLFGRVTEVHVVLDDSEDKGYYIQETLAGNSVAEVISLIQYSARDIEKKLKDQIEDHIKTGLIKSKEGLQYQEFFKKQIHSYTYLDVRS